MLGSVRAPVVRVALRQQQTVAARAVLASLQTPFGRHPARLVHFTPRRDMSTYRELSLDQLYARLRAAQPEQPAPVAPDAPIRLPTPEATLEEFKTAHKNLLDEIAVPLNKFESGRFFVIAACSVVIDPASRHSHSLPPLRLFDIAQLFRPLSPSASRTFSGST